MTVAENRKVDPEDVGRIAVVFFLEVLKRCPACAAGLKCSMHGLDIMPDDAPEEEVSSEDYRAVIEVYFAEFKRTRGEEPVFADRDGQAVKRLIKGVGRDRAIALVRGAYSDPGKAGYITITMISADPARVQGKSGRGGTSTVQRTSGYQGQKGERV